MLLAATAHIPTPAFDWHAFAPELVLVATMVVVLIADLLLPDRESWRTSSIAAVGLLGALVPIATLVHSGHDRSMFDGAYVVDHYALALKAFFIVATYITVLLAVDYIGEGDYYKGEFYFLLLVSTFGMSVMASSRDLISLFVALETISIPTFVLAAFRKHDRASNEAGVKYYLIGVLSSALMLYGFSLIYGVTGATKLSDISAYMGQHGTVPLVAVAIFLSLVGFAFKVSAVPFHFWAPDTYEGAPTPVTAFLSVASKAGGFVALINIIYFGFLTGSGHASDSWWPVLWVLAALSMTIGNLTALRQTNIVRMLAYSSIAQGGFMLVPFAAAGIAGADGHIGKANDAMSAVVIYLLIYGAMNLGAFAVVIAVARRTRSAEISSYDGLFQTAPTLAVVMGVFLASLAGIPFFAGWFAKFVMFRSIIDAGTGWAVALGIIAAVNSVIAFFYYARPIRAMIFHDPPTDDRTPLVIPQPLMAAIALTVAVVVVVGIYPQVFARVGELAFFDAIGDVGADVSAVAANIAQLIHREGPITFDRFMDVALYGEGGFFEAGHGAGRAGRDFVTSPEVGPLFGVCTARALDRLWRALDEPDPFLVVEAGAGNGRLAREVLRATPACLRALRYVLVERSPSLPAEQRERLALEPADEALGPFVRRTNEDEVVPAPSAGPVFTTLEELPALSASGTVVLANELLDNLPFGIAEWDGRRWLEVRVALRGPDRFEEVLVPIDTDLGYSVPVGTRVPIPRGMQEWWRVCDGVVEHGFVLVIDYATTISELASRPWLRTYRAHSTGSDPLDAPGEQDITADVVLEQLDDAAALPRISTERQADWLGALGIDELVDDGRRIWEAGAARGDVEALAGRSRATEAAALVDPGGLGAHRVVLFGAGGAGDAFSW